jgi:hypothetical protein
MKKFTKDFEKMNLNDKKNRRRNKNKKEEPKIEKPREEMTEEEIFQEDLTNLKEKLRELKNIFDQNRPKKIREEDKIENYIIIENFVDFNKVKQKIIQCFNSEDIYSSLFNLWKKSIEFSKKTNMEKIQDNIEENNISDEDDDKKKKTRKRSLLFIFNKLLMNLCCFTPKIISNQNNDKIKEEICNSICDNLSLIKDIEDGENFLYYITEVFGIKEMLKNKFINEHKEKMNEFITQYLAFGLNFINLFDLQEMFPLEKLMKIISDNYYLISYHLYSLLSKTYIKNDESKKYLIVDNILKLLKEEKSIAQYTLVYELINKDFKSDDKKNEIIKNFISVLHINLDKPIRSNMLDNAINYCHLIFENSDLFDKEHIEKTKEYICSYFNNLDEKEWKLNLNKLNTFKYEDLKDYLDTKNSFLDYYENLPLTKIESFVKILKFMPNKITKLLNEYSKKRLYNDGFRIIKMLKLSEEEIPENYKREKIKQFFHYKVKNCEEENNPHNLIDYCLISQNTLEAGLEKILDFYYKGERYNYFYLYVINEIYYAAIDSKYLKLSKKRKKEIDDIYYKLNYKDKYSFKDHFGPVQKDCLQIDQNKTKVFFIDDVEYLEKILNQYFINTKYVGIDSEWQQCMKIIDKTEVSIIQICNYEENCCILLDMLYFSSKDKFYDIFEKYFQGKIFIGFSFDRNDLNVFPIRLKNFFENNNKCTIYDLVPLSQQKFLEKGQPLKNLTEKIFGKSLCKYEQCSNWNARPLSQCQIHYGALDALVCIMIYKKLLE